MMNAGTKVELIKKIAALPESLPDERIDEIERLLIKINDLLSSLLEH